MITIFINNGLLKVVTAYCQHIFSTFKIIYIRDIYFGICHYFGKGNLFNSNMDEFFHDSS